MSPTVGKFCTPVKPARLTSCRKLRHEPEGIGAAHAGQHGGLAATGRTSRAMSMTIALASP
jgi:hypothetical protein